MIRILGTLALLFSLNGCAALQSKPSAPWVGSFGHEPWPSAFYCEWGPANINRSRVVDDAALGAKVLRVHYPAKGLGPAGGGTQFLSRFGSKGHPFPGNSEHLFVRYWLYFEQDFDFSKGGKLPGLAGNTQPGKSPKTGGGGEPLDDSEGFSARIMWREDGRAFQYVYHPGQTGDYGSYFGWQKEGQMVRFQRGRWHQIETEIRLNAPGEKDGVLRSWLDGALVLEREDLVFRRGSDLKINAFFFDTFFGGAEPDWAPKVDSYARFGPITVGGTRPPSIAPGAPLPRR